MTAFWCSKATPAAAPSSTNSPNVWMTPRRIGTGLRLTTGDACRAVVPDRLSNHAGR